MRENDLIAKTFLFKYNIYWLFSNVSSVWTVISNLNLHERSGNNGSYLHLQLYTSVLSVYNKGSDTSTM